MSSPLIIFILGRPGAGKDTQAELLVKNYNLEHIETSDLIRKEFVDNPEDSEVKKQKLAYDSGRITSGEWAFKLVTREIERLKADNFNGKRGVIFSGSPRTLKEANLLIPYLEEVFQHERIFAFYLDISEEEGVRRILDRDARPLDRDVEKIKIRMEKFKEQTDPVIEYMRERGILVEIDGMGTIEQIHQSIIEKLDKKGV